MRILHWCCDQTMTEALNNMGLTASQGRLMAFLAHRGEQPTYAKDVEAEFHLSHPTVSGLLSRLEQKDFLELKTDPNDRRRTLVRITPKGEESRLICESRLNDYITGIMDDLGEEFCQQFAKDAETLLQAIERQNEKLLAEKEKMP